MTKRGFASPTGPSDFMVFHGERSVRDREELRCRKTRRIAPQDTREADAGTRNQRRREREKDGEEEEKGGRSYVSPPPEVGGPRNRLRGRSAIRPTVSVRVPDVRSSRLASASASSNPWTNLCGWAVQTASFASLNPSGPSSRLSSRPISRPSEFTWFTSTAAPSRLPISGISIRCREVEIIG